MSLEEWGAMAFGAVVGWLTYYILRYRSGERSLSDLATVLGVIGGAAVLKLFPEGTRLFGAYGIGLALGFFAYVLILLIVTLSSGGAEAVVNQAEKQNPFMRR